MKNTIPFSWLNCQINCIDTIFDLFVIKLIKICQESVINDRTNESNLDIRYESRVSYQKPNNWL